MQRIPDSLPGTEPEINFTVGIKPFWGLDMVVVAAAGIKARNLKGYVQFRTAVNVFFKMYSFESKLVEKLHGW